MSEVKPTYVKVCLSEKCAGRATTRGVVVETRGDRCPRCGYMLFTKKEGVRVHRGYVERKQNKDRLVF